MISSAGERRLTRSQKAGEGAPAVQAQQETPMHRVCVLSVAFGLSAAAALAADPKVEAAIKAFAGVESDPAKLKIYCDLSKVMDAAGEDETKAAAAQSDIDGYLKKLGPEFESAWDAGEGLEENSPDGKTYDDALNKLDEKCPD
jgi:hypothetical protein